MGAWSSVEDRAWMPDWNRYQRTACALALGVSAIVASGCGSSTRSDARAHDGDGAEGGAGRGGTSTGGTGPATGGSAGMGGAGGEPATECTPQPLLPRRLVRLSSYQVLSSVAALAGAELADGIAEDEAVDPPNARPFLPLAEEGPFVGSTMFSFSDRVGETVGKNVLADFAGVTGCDSPPTDECGQQFVMSFAERAYRRPLADAERESLLAAYAEFKSVGATVPEAVQHGVWAVLDSPYFLYRTEFGADGATEPELPLAPYEMASLLSYFLTGAPPDDELLAAARRDELASAGELAAQARRLLDERPARANLVAAMASYFSLGRIPATVIDPTTVPGLDLTNDLLRSMVREGELFFENTLFDRPLGELLTSRRAYVSDLLAEPIYGVAPPTTGLDADGFGVVELGPERAGLLTSAPFLAARARPSDTSAVVRGLAVATLITCHRTPPYPDGFMYPSTLQEQASWSQRQRAEYRASKMECAQCHDDFDPYGLALEGFDAVGRARTVDLANHPIDTAVTLPVKFEGRSVSDAAEMAQVIAESDVFKACMALRYTEYALAEPNMAVTAALEDPASRSCEVQRIVEAFDGGSDPSFAGLITEIASSRLLRLREGEAQ